MIYFKIGLFGVSGSGKTFSALRVAKGLVNGEMEKVSLINTEDQITAIYKKRLGNFYLQDFQPPYDPNRLGKAIEYFIEKKYKCLVIDSISHFWIGSGGMMDIQHSLGGDFSAWRKANPIYNKLIDSVVKSPIHIIITGRKKTDYVVEQNEKGKMAPRKVGLADVMRDGFDYELTACADINQQHLAMFTKDRTGVFMPDESEQIPRVLTEKDGERLVLEFKDLLEEEKQQQPK